MEECVFIDAVRTPNGRAHAEKGWFRALRPGFLLTSCYEAIFARNPKVKPEDVEAVLVGCANISGAQTDIGRLGWLAGGFPDSVPSNTITNQCPSGMSAIMHAARAIMTGETEIMLAAGVEDMEKVPMGANYDFPHRLGKRYNGLDLMMGSTAEKVAEEYKIARADMDNMSVWSHQKAWTATQAGKFKNEIVPIMGLDDNGQPFLVDRDQWVREKMDPAKLATMQSPFKPGGNVTAATSSPLTQGATALLLMSRKKADAMGLSYSYKYHYGVLAGCDPTLMGMGPVPAVKKLFAKTGLTAKDIAAVELNEAFASQSLACIRELGLDKDNAPFEKVNMWGGALALGHPLGESGARIITTLLNVMKTEKPEGKYGLASLCGAFGNAAALTIEKV